MSYCQLTCNVPCAIIKLACNVLCPIVNLTCNVLCAIHQHFNMLCSRAIVNLACDVPLSREHVIFHVALST